VGGDEAEGPDGIQRARQERMSLGTDSTCVLVGDGTLQCWGQEDNDGNTSPGVPLARPEPVLNESGTAPLADVHSVAAGSTSTCALVEDGAADTIRCWGENQYGKLGAGTGVIQPPAGAISHLPVAVVNETETGLLAGVTAIATANQHACAVLQDTTVRCWGQNYDGQLGQDPTYPNLSSNPVPVPVRAPADGSHSADGSLTGVTGLALGETHSCAVVTGGEVWCWGRNGFSQLGWPAGAGGLPRSGLPLEVPLPQPAVALSSDGMAAHTCAVLVDTTVWCWGDSRYGGSGSEGSLTLPTQIRLPDGSALTGVVAVTVGQFFSCALLSGSGAVRCWGINAVGQLGIGTSDGVAHSKVVEVLSGEPDGSPLRGVTTVSSGTRATCVVKADKSMWCWGFALGGALGNPGPFDADFSTVPVPVIDLPSLNRPPTAVSQTVDVTVGSPKTVRLFGSDRDGDPLTFSVSSPDHGTVSLPTSVSCGPDGTCTAEVIYTPAVGSATDSFTFTVNDGTVDSPQATMTITVVGNQAPVAAAASTSTNEDQLRDVTLTGSDPDGDTLAFAVVDQPANGTVSAPAPASCDPSGECTTTVTYTPSPNFPQGTTAVDDPFTFTVSDGSATSAKGTVAVTVNPVPDDPVAADDLATTPEDTGTTVDVLANDTDADGNSLTVTSAGPTAEPGGTATPTPDGLEVAYTPAAGLCGEDSFPYTVDDGTGRTATATVTVEVDCVTDPPSVSTDGPYSGTEGSPVTLAGVVADPDAGGPPTSEWTFAAGAGVDAGASCAFGDASEPATTVTCSDDGTYTLTLTADDGTHPPQVATTMLTLVNTAPDVDVTGPEGEVAPGGAVTVTASFSDDGANDSHTATVDWGDGAGPHDVVVDEQAGTLTTTGSYQSGGVYTVTVEACDDDGGCTTRTVEVTVDADICDFRAEPSGSVITGTAGDDIICGGAGNDTLVGMGGNDTLLGGGGDDVLRGGPGDDRLDGGDGAHDRASWSGSTRSVTANLTTGAALGEGNDTMVDLEDLYGTAAADTLVGDGRSNVLMGGRGNDRIFGLDGDDELEGLDGGDDLFGGPGADVLDGGADLSPDRLRGDAGQDTLGGGPGADTLVGGDDRDRLFGGDGRDELRGGDDLAPDVLRGGRGADTLHGGPGGDSVYGDSGNDRAHGGDGADTLYGGDGADTLYGGDGDDRIEGGAGSDGLFGGDGVDQLMGDAGADLLAGGAGNDRLFGNAGGDVLHGGTGQNLLDGGAGTDRCSFGLPGEQRTSCEGVP